jgi:hypothetical protein
MISGCSLVIHALLVSALMPHERRSHLLVRRAGLGAAFTRVISAIRPGFFPVSRQDWTTHVWRRDHPPGEVVSGTVRQSKLIGVAWIARRASC